MKKLLLFLLPAITIYFFTSCKKNYAEEHYTEIVNPVIPDFTTQVTAAVNGFITDENSNAVEGATVKAGTVTVITDQFGYFTISAAAFPKSAGFVQVNKSGYFTGYRTFLAVTGKETFIRLQLIPKTNSSSINSTAGGSITTSDGAIISLPPGAVVNASNNSAYTGSINIAAHWLDPSSENIHLTMPGNLTGVDSAGHLNILITYGMMAVELTGNNGEALQITPGKKASLRFPLPASLAGSAPASIPLWYFDETKGVWVQEGNAVRNGNNYEGNVSHFTFWNCDTGMPLVNFSMQLTDDSLHPVANTAVMISPAGQQAASKIDYTDANGEVRGLIPANSDLSVEVLAPCNQRISIRNIQTTYNNLNIGTVMVNLLQPYIAVFKGTANKCAGPPVTDGFVIIKESGLYHYINIQNGLFNAALTICPNANATVTIVDRESMQQSSPRTIAAMNGINDLGLTSTCLSSSGEYFIYELDGATSVLNLPDHQFTGAYSLATRLTQIMATNLITGYNSISFLLNGADTAGEFPVEGALQFCPLNSTTGLNTPYDFINPTTVTISQYGLIGQFIKGSYSGMVQLLSDNSLHTLNFTFNIKRDQ